MGKTGGVSLSPSLVNRVGLVWSVSGMEGEKGGEGGGSPGFPITKASRASLVSGGGGGRRGGGGRKGFFSERATTYVSRSRTVNFLCSDIRYVLELSIIWGRFL